MKGMIGKINEFEAVIGVSAPSSCGTKVMVCLENVVTANNGLLFREHCWVERIEGMPKKGKRIAFSSRIKKYLSIDETFCRVTKIGLSKLKDVRSL